MNRFGTRVGLLLAAAVVFVTIGCSTSSRGELAGRNGLGSEKSPYLLQHADNPINWYPWGEEAFQAAAREDKPIFLSIGYSACHWCHVMEEESFTNPAVAALLNESLIAILVDREERPDIDSIYMTAANLISGRGGDAGGDV